MINRWMPIWVLGMVIVLRAPAQVSVNGVNYVNTYKALAVAEEQRTGVPAAITLAQGLHESEAGMSELVRNSNNHFGIKCKEDWKGGTYFHDDDSRQECFRSYPTAEDSYRDHSDFLKRGGRYAALFQLDPTDYAGWAYGLKKAGYATNIRYSQILIRLIKDYNLQQYTLIAVGKMAASDEVVLVAPGGVVGPGVAGTMGAAGQAGAGTAGLGGVMPGARPDTGMAGQGSGGIGAGGIGRGDAATASTQASYPEGEFMINRTRVVYVSAGAALLGVANQFELPLGRLLEFNDMKEEDVLVRGQLIFLQRKRRTGASEYHVVREGEGLYDIAQAEGVRLQDLLEMNQLWPTAQPAAGERIYLQRSAPGRPRLVGEIK